MALVVKDRVKETTTSTGTGTVTLAGATQGYQSFSVVGDGNTTYYTITDGTNWEVGIGTYTASGTTLSRDTILESSNSGSAVNFSAGVKDVFVTYPAEKAVTLDGTETLTNKTINASNNTVTNVSLTTGVTGTLPVANGGTGATSLTSGYVLKGNGTSPVSASVIYDDGTNVGIGTSSPSYKLDVVTASATQARFAYNSTNYVEVNYDGFNIVGGAMVFKNAGTERMRITSGGNTVIADGKFLSWGNEGQGLLGENATSALRLYTAYNERLRITSAGDVGVGTTSPLTKFDVRGTINSSDGTNGNVRVYVDGTNAYLQSLNQAANAYRPLLAMGSTVSFANNGVTNMTLDASGSLGIGTSSPSSYNAGGNRLVVGGGSFEGMTIASATEGNIYFADGTTGTQTYSGVIGYNHTSDYMTFYANANERMRIDSSGSVIASVDMRAPIFYDSDNTGFYLDLTSSTSLNAAGSLIASGNITLNNGANRRVRLGSATNYYYDIQSTGNDFQIIEAGTTPRLTIKYPSGSVGIGTTAPTGLLSVASTSSAGTTIGSWTSAHSVFGPNVGSTTGAALGLGYNTTTDTAEIVSIAPSVAWKNMRLIAATMDFETISGRVQTNQSFRAPIFYDSNNTGYYFDGSSTSVLNALTVNGGAVYRSDWTTRFQSPSDFVNGTLVSTDIPATASSGDSFVIEITGKSYSASNPPFKAVAQGYLYNNTIINFSGINYGGEFSSYIRVFEDGGVLKFWWPRISYWNSFNVNVMSMDSATNGTITRNRVTSITNSTEPTGSKKQTINLAGFMRSDISATNSVDLRAPIFYDSGNTGYYVDPASTSVVNQINYAAGLYFSGNTNYGINGTSAYFDTVNSGAVGDPLELCYVRGNEVRIGPSGGNLPIKAATYYDYADTNYYLDPNSGSKLFDLNIEGTGNKYLYIYSTSGNEAMVRYIGGSSSSWYVGKRTAAQLVGTADFHFFSEAAGATVAGIDTAGNIFANSSVRAPIFYDYNNTGYYVDPAGTSFTNIMLAGGGLATYDSAGNDPYGKLSVTRNTDANYAYLGFTRVGQMVYQMGIDTSNRFWIGGGTAGYNGVRSDTYLSFSTNGDVTAKGDFRAPIFYDSNNTGYYINPNETSVTWRMGANYFQSNDDVSFDTPFGLYFANTLSSAYAIFRESGGWTHPYPDLRIAFHTGIKIGANAGYGGVKFYTDYDMATQVMSVNNGSDGLGAGNVYVNNSLQAGSSLRAPIFYDSDNTGYYADLSSTGDSIRAAGDIVAYYSDDRLKDRGDNIANALDKVQSLNGFHYTANETAQKFGYKANPQVGVSAQEVEAVLPEVVKDAAIGHGYKTVDYAKLVPLLIEAIKELKAEVETLKKG